MSSIDELADIFARFPGIGPRQSKRFVYFLLRQNPHFIDKLIKHLSVLKDQISVCDECFQYFPKENSKTSVCEICRSPNRNRDTLMVVEKDMDLENIERSGVFDGVYFVLGGTISLSDDIGDRYIRSEELEKRVVSALQDDNLSEIIIATSATTEGDHTRLSLKEKLAKVLAGKKVKISSLGRGLSTGTELEYSDKETLKNALSNRKASD